LTKRYFEEAHLNFTDRHNELLCKEGQALASIEAQDVLSF